MKKEFKIGQQWRARNGELRTIDRLDDVGGYRVSACRSSDSLARLTYDNDGRYIGPEEDSQYDLLEHVVRVYIAGPMSGMPGLNFAAFFAAAELYRQRGCVVINPAELHPEAADEVAQMSKAEQLEHWRKCMKIDIREMLTCDMVVMLDGWTASRGATLEHHVAHSLGLAVVWHK